MRLEFFTTLTIAALMAAESQAISLGTTVDEVDYAENIDYALAQLLSYSESAAATVADPVELA